jgi:hypothetical protein
VYALMSRHIKELGRNVEKCLVNKGFARNELFLDGQAYDIYRRQPVSESPSAPRLAVISYVPTHHTATILNLCIRTIKKFTDIPYELWVVDNNSPVKNIDWLIEEEGINLVLNRTAPREAGSYANAIGLEIAAAMMPPDTKYFMTLHQDVAPCKKGWLPYLLSKMNGDVKAAGVRMDRTRVKEGILHVLGYLIDFQIFKELKLDFYPKLPGHDVGDMAMVKLREAGYQLFAAPNTLWDKTLIERIPDDSPFKTLNVDRSFDDNGDVFFLHLGRGVEKAKEDREDGGEDVRRWEEFIATYLLDGKDAPAKHKGRLPDILGKLNSDLSYSVRRYYVDEFYMTNITLFGRGARILDMGGKKLGKRGCFDIGTYSLDVEYCNIDEDAAPDYLCDISAVPVADSSYDGVILSEVLEHVAEPRLALREAYRVLRSGGRALICSPFIFHLHADPHDYGRYTDHYFQGVLSEIGFRNIEIEKQGLFFSVLANMLKLWAYELSKEGRPNSRFQKKLLHTFVFWLQGKSFAWEKDTFYRDNKMLSGHTTGFGIVCEK